MHTHTIHTRFTVGDRVKFDSPTQRCSGFGTVVAITFDDLGHIDYLIRVDDEDLIQPGILEKEMMLEQGSGSARSGPDPNVQLMYTHVVSTRYTFRDRIKFDSPIQRRSGAGSILLITFDDREQVDFTIDVDNDYFAQGGILESEMVIERKVNES